jgi:16S rRNA (cytosine967-C5)-methyltransferase
VIQDPAASAVVDYIGPDVRAPVLDVCAAPGGKSISLAALTGASPFIAADVSHRRLRSLVAAPAYKTLGIFGVVMDGRAPALARAATVVLDAPCTGTGTLRRRPDARWRLTPRRLMSLVDLQRELLDASAELIEPGGLLVYATCSIEPEENEDQVDAFLDRHTEFELEAAPSGCELPADVFSDRGELVIRPWMYGTDGSYAARLRRRSPP